MATNDHTSTNNHLNTSGQLPVYSAMTSMYEAARKGLSETELDAISDLTDTAVSEALNLSQVTAGIAVLVDTDGRNTKSDWKIFQEGESVFSLLCAISHSLDTIAGMVKIGVDADFELNERRKQVSTQ